MAVTVDDNEVWDEFTSDLSVGVGCNRLIIAMESLIGECAPRDRLGVLRPLGKKTPWADPIVYLRRP